MSTHDKLFLVSLVVLMLSVGMFGLSASTVEERMFLYGMSRRQARGAAVFFLTMVFVMIFVTVALLPA